MMPTEQKLQGNRISLHLISVFSPKMILRTSMKMYQFHFSFNSVFFHCDKICLFVKSKPPTNDQDKGYCTRMLLATLPEGRRGAELFLVQALLLLFLERILPGNEMLWVSPWEPPGPRPW